MAEACRKGDTEGRAHLAEPSPGRPLTHGKGRWYQGVSCVRSGSAPLSLSPDWNPDYLSEEGSLSPQSQLGQI